MQRQVPRINPANPRHGDILTDEEDNIFIVVRGQKLLVEKHPRWGYLIIPSEFPLNETMNPYYFEDVADNEGHGDVWAINWPDMVARFGEKRDARGKLVIGPFTLAYDQCLDEDTFTNDDTFVGFSSSYFKNSAKPASENKNAY